MQSLSKKGVLFLTAGFKQTYTFQNVTSYIQDQNDNLGDKMMKIILSDGEIYISGVYLFNSQDHKEVQKCQNIQQYDILKVNATYQGPYDPIFIQSLQIWSQNHEGIYGQLPVSIQDYIKSKLVKKSSNNNINQQIQANHPNSDELIVGGFQDKQSGQIQINNLNERLVIQPIQYSKQPIQQIKSSSQDSYAFIDELMDIKKRNQRERNQLYAQQNQQTQLTKRIKPNQENFQKENQKNNSLQQTQPYYPPYNLHLNNIHIEKTQEFQHLQKQKMCQKSRKSNLKNTEEIRIIQVDVIDLDDMTTQKQQISFYKSAKKNGVRKSHMKSLQSVFQSQEKHQKISFQNDESLTLPKFILKSMTTPFKGTPMKVNERQNELISFTQVKNGTTTIKRKIKQEYDSLISNLYEDNHDFKILCRVNHVYEWISRNGTPCLGAELMDMDGFQIKAIIYINHPRKQCQGCSQIVEVGKVYCFQNGQCKRNQFQKNQLQLIFNLRNKFKLQNSVCNGRNKINPATKITIEPIIEERFINISKAIQMFDQGKNYIVNIYGLIENMKIFQYENKKQFVTQLNEENSAELANQVNITDKQSFKHKENDKLCNGDKQNTKHKQTDKQKIIKSQIQSFKKIYLHGNLVDPIDKKQIFFSLMLPKPIQELDLTTDSFLQKNNIKNGSFIILHNVRISSINNNTIKKIQKTKRTYLQVVTQNDLSFKFDRTEFAAQTISIKNRTEPYFDIFHSIIGMNSIEINSILQNPRFIDYSEQPYTLRRIQKMNDILENNIMDDQFCHSQIKNVRIHAIQQKNCIDICEYCKKKVKNQNAKTKQLRFCTKCKKIVKTIKMHILSIIFADNTASFFVQLLKDGFIEIILGIEIQRYVILAQNNKKELLDKIKYDQFNLKVKSQKKIGGITHRIMSVQRMSLDVDVNQIRVQRKGEQKHYTRLQTSW